MLEDHIRLKSINHTTYNVRDKEAALKWYQDVLGLKQIPKMVNSEHLYWLQLPSGAMVHIIENPDAPSAPSHHTAFEVDDLEAARAAVTERTCAILLEPVQGEGAGAQSAPVGLPFWLSEVHWSVRCGESSERKTRFL